MIERHTTNDSLPLIGTVRTIKIGSLSIDVKIKDVKNSYGKTRYLVAPLAGHGEQWMESIYPGRSGVTVENYTFPQIQ